MPMALVTERTRRGVVVGGARVASGGWGWSVEEGLRSGDQGAPLPIGE